MLTEKGDERMRPTIIGIFIAIYLLLISLLPILYGIYLQINNQKKRKIYFGLGVFWIMLLVIVCLLQPYGYAQAKDLKNIDILADLYKVGMMILGVIVFLVNAFIGYDILSKLKLNQYVKILIWISLIIISSGPLILDYIFRNDLVVKYLE